MPAACAQPGSARCSVPAMQAQQGLDGIHRIVPATQAMKSLDGIHRRKKEQTSVAVNM